MMNGRKHWVRGAAWFLSTILLLQAPPLGAAEGWEGFSQGVSGVLQSPERYTVRFLLDGEAAETLFVPVGSPIGEVPAAPERALYAFRGWFDGDTQVDADFVPAGDMALTGRYDLMSPVQTLEGETDLGAVTYQSLTGYALPGGAEVQVKAFEEEAILDKVDTDQHKRILFQLRFGVSDPYWTPGSVRVTLNLLKPLALEEGESLRLLDREGRAFREEDVSFRTEQGKLTGITFAADPLGRVSLIGCYEEKPAVYTVSFLADGEETESRPVAYGQAIGPFPQAPEKEGCIFTGWVSGEIEGVNEASPVYGDVTVSAVYEEAPPALGEEDGKEAAAPADGRIPEPGSYWTLRTGAALIAYHEDAAQDEAAIQLTDSAVFRIIGQEDDRTVIRWNGQTASVPTVQLLSLGAVETDENRIRGMRRAAIRSTKAETVTDGEEIELKAVLEGFDDVNSFEIIWEADKGNGWEEVGRGDAFTYTASAESITWRFRLRVDYRP